MTAQIDRSKDMIDNTNLGMWMNWSKIVKIISKQIGIPY